MNGKQSIRVCVTGAAGQIAYALSGMIVCGQVFGTDQSIDLSLLDIEPAMSALNGLAMELKDFGSPLLHSILATHDAKLAYKDIDYVFLLSALPMTLNSANKDLRKDLRPGSVKLFKDQGEALETVARKTVKVLVVSNPANTNTFICRHFAPSIPSQNFSALSRLDHNRAVGQVAEKLGICPSDIHNVVIWGNHSPTQVPDLRHANISTHFASKMAALEAIDNLDWIKNVFIPNVKFRGFDIIEARKKTAVLSAAKAAADHMHDWHFGTAPNAHISMGVVSDGSYGIPEGLVYSFPVAIAKGEWTIVQGLLIDDELRCAMDVSTNELIEERDQALEVCKSLR